jgi:glycerol uptake facilitator-like aquaporin
METLGSFVLVFLYLSQTEEKTKLSNDPAITTAIIAASYLTAITLGYSSQNATSFSISPLNFAISLAQITMMTFNGNMSATSYQWIYLTFNWLGSILAVLAYELIFRKAESAVEARDD